MSSRLHAEIWTKIFDFIMLPDRKSFDRFQHRIKYLATISSVCKESRAGAQSIWAEFHKEYRSSTNRHQLARLKAFEPIVRGSNRWQLKSIQHYFPSARKKSLFAERVWEFYGITEATWIPIEVLDAMRRDRSQYMHNFYHLRQLWRKRDPIARKLISSPYQQYLNVNAGMACDIMKRAYGTMKGMRKYLKNYKKPEVYHLNFAAYCQRARPAQSLVDTFAPNI